MSLAPEQLRRLGGLAGITFIILAVVALFLPGTPPKADEFVKVTEYLGDKRGSILASNYVLGVAFVFFLIFVGALRTQIGAADRSGLRMGAPILAGGVAAATLVLAGAAVINGAAFRVSNDVGLNLDLYYVANDIFFMSGFGFAAFFIASGIGISTTGALPSALAPAALVLALLNVISAFGLFAKSGFFAIGGAYGFIVPVLSLIWVLAASIAMLRSAGPGPGPGPAAPAASG